MKCQDTYAEMYHRDARGIAFCPYRICPMGAHSDHQYGKVTGLALDKGIHIAYSPKSNGVVELSSLDFDKRAQFHVRQVPEQRQNDWADYLRGATRALGERYPLSAGLSGVIEGSLPIGGLSSSAAVILAFLNALCSVNDIRPDDAEMIDVALEAETRYVGVSVGKLDQSCEVYSRKDCLLYLDTLDGCYEIIPQNAAMKPYEIAIFFSGIERTLVGSAYNSRVDEMKAAAYMLESLAIDSGLEKDLRAPYGRFSEARLRYVPRDMYDRFKNRLPERWRRRAEHFYTEFERVEQGAQAWRCGDLDTFGRLSFESGLSSIENYETGSAELKTLYDIMRHTDGIYGGRFSGAGFKGCCMALIDPTLREQIVRRVGDEYLRAFPALSGKYSSHICRSADGVSVAGKAVRS